MAKRKAFTLIEMLVVITIIAILAAVAVSSYGIAGQRARLDVGVDSVVSVLKQQQGLSKSGRVVNVGGGAGTKEAEGYKCYGMYFSDNDPYVQLVEADYVSVDVTRADYCKIDPNSSPLRVFPELGNLVLTGIEKDNQELNKLVVMFKPPFGNIVLGDLNEVQNIKQEKEVKIGIGLKNGGDSAYFSINFASGLIERIYE